MYKRQAEELKRVEDIVNEKINEAIEVRTDVMLSLIHIYEQRCNRTVGDTTEQ